MRAYYIRDFAMLAGRRRFVWRNVWTPIRHPLDTWRSRILRRSPLITPSMVGIQHLFTMRPAARVSRRQRGVWWADDLAERVICGVERNDGEPLATCTLNLIRDR